MHIICGLLSVNHDDFMCHFHTGQEPNDQVVDGMMSEATGPLNFTMFLTLFGEKLTGMYVEYSYWHSYNDHIWTLLCVRKLT